MTAAGGSAGVGCRCGRGCCAGGKLLHAVVDAGLQLHKCVDAERRTNKA